MMKRLLGLLLLPLALSATNGYLQTGIGVKSKMMGGVGVAYPQDAFASAMNPAGLIQMCNRWDVGFHWWGLNGRLDQESFDPPFAYQARTHENLYWPEVAISYAFCPCMSAGLAFYATGGFRTNYGETLAVGTLPPNVLSSHYNLYTLTPSLSWRLSCLHSLGVAVNISVGYFRMTGLEAFDDPLFTVTPGYFTDKGNNYSAGIGVRVGWLGQLTPKLSLGATYQSKTWMNHYADYRGFFADHGNFDLPSQWGFGITYKWLPCLVTSIDIVRVNWTDVKMLRNDNNQARFGAIDGRGFGWRDTWIVKGGFAYTFCKCYTIRGGWNYGDQLFGGPETLLNAIPLAPVEHFASIGLTWAFGCWEASIDYVYGLRHGVDYEDEDLISKIISYENSVGLSLGRRF
ncbi:MAG: OmpP1/FadL family transporter [Parachlamydiales bacterium]